MILPMSRDYLADALGQALRSGLDMDAPDAAELAHIVAATFGDKGEVDDMTLRQDLRAIFYTLERKRWLGFRRDEVKTEDGATRRVFFWSVRWTELLEAARTESRGAGAARAVANVYESLPRTAWRRTA